MKIWIMFLLKKYCIPIVMIFISVQSAKSSMIQQSSLDCLSDMIPKDMSKVLPCYLRQEDSSFYGEISNRESETVFVDNTEHKLIILTLELTSLTWQKDNGVDYPEWKHNINIYVPLNRELHHNSTALLYINGGARHAKANQLVDYQYDNIKFADIAARTQSVVIDVQDVPNQYLRFYEGEPLRENSLTAYTWARFLMNPDKNFNWPLQLPMVKSVQRAMQAVQDALFKERRHLITDFVLSGASKRGWTSLLTAAVDMRVAGVIPIVADFMNMTETFPHLFKVYKDGNPALEPFMRLRYMIGTEPMNKLLTVIDPYQYKEKLNKPVFMVSATGDDFLPPDTSGFFFSDLPGEKWMRMLPDENHYVVQEDSEKVSRIIESFYGAFLRGVSTPKSSIPELTWTQEGGKITVTSSTPPKSANVWQAANRVARDFRKTKDNINVTPFKAKAVQFICSDVCTLEVNLPNPTNGWIASFVEVSYNNAPYEDLVFTTRVFVTPDTYPEH